MSNKLIMTLLILTTYFSGYAVGEQIKLQSGDGTVANGPIFTVSKRLLSEYSKTLRDMFEDVAGEDTPIPLPNINRNTLGIIIDCVQHPDDATGILLSLTEEQLIAVTKAIIFLDIPKLYAQLPQVKWVKSIAKIQSIQPITLSVNTGSISSVAISPDNTFIITGSADNTAIIWDAKTGKQKHTLQGHTGPIFSVAISPDNTFIVTGSMDKTAIIWDANTSKQKHTLQGHTGSVSSVAINPDNTFIVTGAFDKTAIIWDAKTGEKIHTLNGHTLGIHSVTISPDNTFIVTGAEDNTAIIWLLYNPEQLDTLQPDFQELIIRIYEAKNSSRLSLNADQTALYRKLPMNLQQIFSRYIR
ncbi:MAG TPA: hypothetical protein PKD74_03630 [Candidatus Dependentiae bacterium]|nr:hypothetical protein [Candidatus Dependentiae bacterium]